MKRSGEQGTMPKGWRLARLGHVAQVAFSGVDKKTVEGEVSVALCNYMDVFCNTEPVEVMSVEEALSQLREAECRRDQAVARMDALLAEMGFSR